MKSDDQKTEKKVSKVKGVFKCAQRHRKAVNYVNEKRQREERTGNQNTKRHAAYTKKNDTDKTQDIRYVRNMTKLGRCMVQGQVGGRSRSAWSFLLPENPHRQTIIWVVPNCARMV